VRLYTRTGDTGDTGLSDGGRVRKSALRVEALGAADEANAAVGWARTQIHEDAVLGPILDLIQHRLFDLGADLALPGASGRVGADDIQGLEGAIDRLSEAVPPLRAFILPGGTPAAEALHVARTAARRAERALVRLADDGEPVDAAAIVYLNRISDLLFAAARFANRRAGDVEWKPAG
jgi:cob(I)alamin adenosyltransferase